MSEEKSKNMHKCGIYEKYIKRPQDCICALIALIILSPVILTIAVMVRIKLGAPVIFRQERPGSVSYTHLSRSRERSVREELQSSPEKH